MQKIVRPGKLLATIILIAVTAIPAFTASLGTKVLKGAAIGYAVKQTAKPLDKFINTITFNHGVRTKLATKVVPILSVGEKGYIGGAQVSGPQAKVDRVKAVFQYEKNFSNNNYRAKILLPSASLNPLKLERVDKVGVTAVIDVALDGRQKYNTVGTGIQAGDVIRGAAVLVAVKNAGSMINKGLNTLTFNKGSVTKVVPMGSIGEKAYLGAAQVSAASKTIGSVNALWQYENLFSGGKFRVKILVPTTSSNPLKMKRVDGAGVTAIVDMALSEQKDISSNNNKTRTIGGILGGKVIEVKHDNGLHKGWIQGKRVGQTEDKKKEDK
jgi:hypothetical protein